MKSKVMMVIALAALFILVSATLAHAGVIYSQDFDGPGVTPGQSVRAAPINWGWGAAEDNNTAYLNSGSHGWTGNYLDGSTASSDNGLWADVGTSLSVSANAHTLIYQADFHPGPYSTYEPAGNNTTIGDENNTYWQIGWSVNCGVISFTWGGGSQGYTWSPPDSSVFYGSISTLQIITDFDDMQVWGTLSNGTDYVESPHNTLTRDAEDVNFFGYSFDRRFGRLLGVEWDNISVRVQ